MGIKNGKLKREHIKRTSLIFCLLLLIFNFDNIYAKPLQINTTVKAAILYFPSPSVMRCLNHSDIPKSFRKGIVTRSVKIPGEKEIEQTVTISVVSKSGHKKFILRGNIKYNDDLFPIKLTKNPFFDPNAGGQKLSFLFGLEDILGLQKKIHVLTAFGNQKLDYEVFLKTTKGMIGKENYKLELFGQDKSIDGEVKYFLDGHGNIGEKIINVTARGLKDYYEIKEQYGEAKVFTTVKVYD